VRTGGTDDIACWFIDTDNDGQSFFRSPRLLSRGDEPYENLKKALRAEIDEGEWAKLYQCYDPGIRSAEERKDSGGKSSTILATRLLKVYRFRYRDLLGRSGERSIGDRQQPHGQVPIQLLCPPKNVKDEDLKKRILAKVSRLPLLTGIPRGIRTLLAWAGLALPTSRPGLNPPIT